MNKLSLFPPQKPCTQKLWHAIAERVLKGDYGKADGSTIKSLMIGLQNIEHPRCRLALEMLKGMK